MLKQRRYWWLWGLILSVAFSWSLVGVAQTSADEREMSVAAFVRDDCQHCRDEKDFLAELQQELPQLEIKYLDLSDSANKELFDRVTKQYGIIKATPLTLVGRNLVSGFGTAETTGKLLLGLLEKQEVPSSFVSIETGGARVVSGGSSAQACSETEPCKVAPAFLVTIPLLGTTINVGTLSLTALSLTLGLIDGFNPCALWVLVMFLVLLAQAGSKKRMWQYAGLFIVAEAVMYYLILTVWFTVWDFVALDRIVTPLVGLLALGSGVYFLYKFKKFKPVCDVTSLEQQQKIEGRTKRLVGKPLTLMVALGIIGLAFSVNVFEFACSIGIPQMFTKVLEMNALGVVSRHVYMLQYILAYMADDLLVFAIALFSLDKLGMISKYSRWSTLVGGLLMLALGLTMLLAPQWLVF